MSLLHKQVFFFFFANLTLFMSKELHFIIGIFFCAYLKQNNLFSPRLTQIVDAFQREIYQAEEERPMKSHRWMSQLCFVPTPKQTGAGMSSVTEPPLVKIRL